MAQPAGDAANAQTFLWGAATAAYQIEGAYNLDGKGPSIWDTFAHTPGKIEHGDTGDVACDHYHRWQADLDLMARLGLRAYRLSISWPRVLPAGRGKRNPTGLDFYDRLVDGLLERGILPFITLYHWDLPQALQDKGGWLNRDTARSLQDYADAVTARLGDRVRHWLTLNEPFITAQFGHVDGIHAPGLRAARNYFPATHHQLLAHGLAVEAIRANVPKAQIGLAYSLAEIQPARDRDADIAAAHFADILQNTAYLDATLKGKYPADLEPHFPPDLVQPGDLAIISRPIEFLGVNYYVRLRAKADPKNAFPGFTIIPPAGGALTAMGWEPYPAGLGYWLRRLARDYPNHALYVTENGAAYPDTIGPDGAVHDPQRRAYLRDHIEAALAARAEGVPLHGYFVWSLFDNFEWHFGYRPRFGLVYVDYPTQRRIIKASGHWYANLIATGEL